VAKTSVGKNVFMNDVDRLVSVIIPSFNKAGFLGEAIESVLQQTYRNFDIVVVDDGSSDNTRDVAAAYPSVRYIRQENQGPSSARNRGLLDSKGEYLVFLDADDRLLPHAFEVGVNALNAHPECAFVSGHVRLIAKDGSYIRTPEEKCIEKDHYQTLLQYNYIWTPAAVMFRRTIFHSIRYSSSRYGTEDWDLYLQIARSFPVYCHDQVLADYRVHDGQLTCDSAHMLKDSLALLRQQWIYVKGNKEYEQAYQKGIRGAQDFYGEPLVNEIQSSLRESEWRRALRGFLVLLRYYPRRLLK
jgi:glycosyltransferase involved in cell wall biosynthesis